MSANNLNIGIMIPTLRKYGGAERYLIETVYYWQKKYDITIYATEFNEDLLIEHSIDLDHIKLVKLKKFYEGDNALLLNTTVLTKEWCSQIHNHDIYIGHLWPMHFTELHPFVWVTHEPLRIMHDLKYENTLSDDKDDVSKNFHLYPKFNYDKLTNTHEIGLNIIDKLDRTFEPETIIANSKYTAKNLGKIYNNDSLKYAVAYPGVNPDSFITDLPFDKNLFITVSQLWSHKRINLLIEAISLTESAQLIIIGSGPENDRLLKTARLLGVSDRVFILSDLTNEDISFLLARACAFLFSAYKEPFGIVILEAMASSKPIICVDEGGFTEVLDSKCAFMLKPYPILFAEKIQYLQNNPDVAKDMGSHARTLCQKYTWKKSSDDIEKAVIETLNRYNKIQNKYRKKLDKKLPLVGIQYFLWYGEGYGSSHWNDSEKDGVVVDIPLIGYYPSVKGNTITKHLDVFNDIGVDFVILNLHLDDNGLNQVELHSIMNFIDLIDQQNTSLLYTIQLCVYTNDLEKINKSILFIKNNLVNKKYLKIDGKDILYWFWSGSFDGFDFIDNVDISSFDILALSNRLINKNEKKITNKLFSSFGLFNPLDLSSLDKLVSLWDFSLNTQNISMKYSAFSVSPGYDDSLLIDQNRENNKFRIVKREEGKTYNLMWDYAIKNKKKIDLLSITSFNEFHENTHIENTSKNGNSYIEITKEKIKQFKKINEEY